jgi:thiol-disulfide isomerase/thioredoxin
MTYSLYYLFVAAVLTVGVLAIWFLWKRVPSGPVRTLGLGFSGVLVFMGSLLLAVVVYQQFFFVPPDPNAPPPLGDGGPLEEPATDFAFRLVDTNETVQLSDYEGQIVLLNLWATWCAPCLKEMPDLNRLAQRYGNDGLAVLTISDEDRATIREFEETLPLQTVSGYMNDDDIPEPFSFFVRPTTYLIDREGQVRLYVLGARDYAFWEQLTQPYLRGDSVVLAAR